MKKLNFEEKLPHQEAATHAVLECFQGVGIGKNDNRHANFNLVLEREAINSNIVNIRKKNGVESVDKKYKENEPLILDIHMETGTGKTYTYTNTMFKLNQEYGVNKFIIVVPTLSIKAGTVNFLKSESARIHFKQLYQGKELECLVVESDTKKKKKKSSDFPRVIKEFVKGDRQDKKYLYVLVINQGMINSDTIQTVQYDNSLDGEFNSCVNAIASTESIMIIDEPHKFKSDNKTWKNLLKFSPQYIIRYGATFDSDYRDLLYSLNAIQAFNTDLVKGLVVNMEEYPEGQNEWVELTSLEGKSATFHYLNNFGKVKKFELSQGDDLSLIHTEMGGLKIQNMNTSVIQLSNGMEIKKKDKLNPYKFSETLQEKMIREAIEKHFEIEEKNMCAIPRIKTMSLFFIDSISSYRNENPQEAHIKILFERILEQKIRERIEKTHYSQYKSYLQESLKMLSQCHGGYFSKDNAIKDEEVEKEVNQILHDKETLLDIDNPLRFIFSKWTLREGWDNPNIFVICKLRGSGSDTNKLQEVGRGLRIPVNEYMNRVKEKDHYLHYFVDFEEKEFVSSLLQSINNSSVVKENSKILDEIVLSKIAEVYGKNEEALLIELLSNKWINSKKEYINDGFMQIKNKFSLVFETVDQNKVKSSKTPKQMVRVRTEKYGELQKLWEEINQKALIRYDFKSDDEYQTLLNTMIVEFREKEQFETVGIELNSQRLEKGETITARKMDSISNVRYSLSHLSYYEFLLALEKGMKTPIQTLHKMFLHLDENGYTQIKTDVREKTFDLNRYLSHTTVRKLIKFHRDFLISHSLTNMFVSYDNVYTKIHPTMYTDSNGSVLSEIPSHNVGVLIGDKDESVAENFLLEGLFFDSDMEKENMKESIREVVVFSKIPKNSIKIPVVGGLSYSPDFAYVVKFSDGKETLNLIIESKDKEYSGLLDDEKMKIKCAEKLFENRIKIKFETQFKKSKIKEIINKNLGSE
ncbi:MAG: type III restriction-modification system endonuclease [Fusobacteria bacterium]|nr:type III restriction-modification system endonuclease [Fusobacteriota bacterium]